MSILWLGYIPLMFFDLTKLSDLVVQSVTLSQCKFQGFKNHSSVRKNMFSGYYCTDNYYNFLIRRIFMFLFAFLSSTNQTQDVCFQAASISCCMLDQTGLKGPAGAVPCGC